MKVVSRPLRFQVVVHLRRAAATKSPLKRVREVKFRARSVAVFQRNPCACLNAGRLTLSHFSRVHELVAEKRNTMRGVATSDLDLEVEEKDSSWRKAQERKNADFQSRLDPAISRFQWIFSKIKDQLIARDQWRPGYSRGIKGHSR